MPRRHRELSTSQVFRHDVAKYNTLPAINSTLYFTSFIVLHSHVHLMHAVIYLGNIYLHRPILLFVILELLSACK